MVVEYDRTLPRMFKLPYANAESIEWKVPVEVRDKVEKVCVALDELESQNHVSLENPWTCYWERMDYKDLVKDSHSELIWPSSVIHKKLKIIKGHLPCIPEDSSEPPALSLSSTNSKMKTELVY